MKMTWSVPFANLPSPWQWGSPRPGAAKLLFMAGKRRKFESLQQEAAIKPNTGLPLLTSWKDEPIPAGLASFQAVWKRCQASIAPPAVAQHACRHHHRPRLILILVRRALLLGSKPTLAMLGSWRSSVSAKGFWSLLEVVVPRAWALFDQITSHVLAIWLLFYIPVNWRTLGFLVWIIETEQLAFTSPLLHFIPFFYGSYIWAWRNKENSSWFPHPGFLVNRY